MKKNVLLGFLMVVLSCSVAQAGLYISGGVGANFNSGDVNQYIGGFDYKTSYKNSPIYSIAVGYDLPILPFRAEIEGLRTTNDVKNRSTSATVNAVMINGYARIPLIGLYAGIGAGYGSVRGDKTPMYQGMLGVEYGIPVLPLTLGIEYRRIQAGDNARELGEKYEFKSDSVLLKVRFGF